MAAVLALMALMALFVAASATPHHLKPTSHGLHTRDCPFVSIYSFALLPRRSTAADLRFRNVPDDYQTEALQLTAPGPGTFDLYYYTTWSTCYLHYNPDNQGWNSIPGALFGASNNASFPGPSWKFIEVAGNSVTFVTTDGNGNWDNNSGRNYVTSQPGIYSLQNGNLQLIQPYPKGCPGTPACSGNGTCNAATGECTCNAGYFGSSCTGICPGGLVNPCSGHGTCDASGNCDCSLGWASCTTPLACQTNVSSDPNNCGGCGKKCVVGPNVASAVCNDATCDITCDSGYTLCSDNTCSPNDACPLPGCQIFTDNQCSGDVIITPANYTDRGFQTPKPDSPLYRPSYQSYYTLQGSLRVVYQPSRLAATVTVVTTQKVNVTLTYTYNGVQSDSPTSSYSSSTVDLDGFMQLEDSLYVVVNGTDGSSLVLDPIDFIWTNPIINQPTGDYRNGQKGSIVELFGWPHTDIEQECAFVSQAGYMGVKVYPMQEQVMSGEPFQNIMNPWYFMYQPVSYRLQGRMGTREELRSMIQTCRQANVRVYGDAVMNHMVGGGNDANPFHRDSNCNYFPQKNSSAADQSPFYTQDFVYEPNWNTGLPPSQEFPAVPWSPVDFHCERALNSWTDPLDLNAGWLTGLTDLNTERPEVQQRLADYITDLLGIGFSGIRMDAAKHIQPDDIVGIFSRLKVNLGGSLPDDFIVWMEVLLGGEADMLLCQTDSGYNYAQYLATALANAGFTSAEIDQLKIWYSAYPKEPGVDCGMLPMNRKAIQNDDSDQQQPGSTSRDMGSDGSILVVDRDIPTHRGFEVTLFENPFGVQDNSNDYPIRMVLSSYYFDLSLQTYGVPDGKSDCSLCLEFCSSCVGTMPYTQAYSPTSTGYDGPVFTHVHRDQSIINAMRSWMQLPSVNVSDIIDSLVKRDALAALSKEN